jgi:membrane protein required for colicin V production
VNWLDWVILGIVGIAVLGGMVRGAVRTIFALAGVIVGFLVASRESGAVGMVLTRWMPEPAAGAVGFVFVFLGVTVIFALAAWLLRKVLEGLLLGWADRVLGAGLGFLQAAVALGVAALVIEGAGSFDAARQSTTYPLALQSGRILLDAIPEETLERLRWDELREKIPGLWEAAKKAEEII